MTTPLTYAERDVIEAACQWHDTEGNPDTSRALSAAVANLYQAEQEQEDAS